MNTLVNEKMFSLEGKTIVLTGAGGVLIGEMALTLAGCGAQTVILDISEEAAGKTAQLISSRGYEAYPLHCDVLNKNNLEACRDKILEKYGKIDCLVNGAGGNRSQATTSELNSFFELSEEAFRNVMDINFTGTVLSCQVFGSEMARRQQGSIINISSIAGFRPLTRAFAYAAGKAAVNNFTRWLAVCMCENYSPNIRVNAIAPGFFATTQNNYLLFDKEGNLTERGQSILNNVPMKRFGSPPELASAAVWLLSDSASFVTGSVFIMDGGFDAFAGV